MSRWYLFSLGVLLTALTSLDCFSQSAGDYRSNVFITGNWATAGSWQRYNGAAWVTATSAPSSANGVISILNGDQIVVNTAVTMDQVVIDPGGELLFSDLFTSFVPVLANGAGNDIDNNGSLIVSVNATLTGAGSIVNNSGGSFIVRNTGTLSVAATNNGTMQVTGVGNFLSNTVTNNGTINFDNTLNLNSASLINKGTVSFDGIFDSNITGTGSGIFTNDYGGILFKTGVLGTAYIDPTPGTVTFTNRGIVKGFSTFAFRSTSINTGAFSPGDASAASLTVNPVFITGKSPQFEIEIVSNGAIAGTNYDQVAISNLDATTVNISGSILDVSDNSTDAVGTTYTIFTSTATIAGIFASVHLTPSLGTLVYNANSITIKKIGNQAKYSWAGGNGSWTVPGNWSPTRTTPAATDMLTFNTGTTITVTNVPTETDGSLTVKSNTTLSLQSAGTSKTLTIGNGYMNNVTVDPGATLRMLNNAGVVLNITIAAGSRVVDGGVIDMQNGTFSVGDNPLQLHTTAVPLTRTSGQFAMGTGGAIEFGDVLHVTGSQIVLSNAIFVAPPTVSRVAVYRLNGAAFGNQSITTGQAALSLGDLTTNAAGKIIFSSAATNPTETPGSKIVGYADMAARAVGTAAVNFLGLSSPAGADIGTVSLSRVTGPSGINTFNGFGSIASTWTVSVSVEPTPSRNMTLSWLSDFDNGINTTLKAQDYRFDGGPGWTQVGPLALLASPANPRVTSPSAAAKLSGSWTIADQNTPLPIELSSFTGQRNENLIVLDWVTQSEKNSDYFEVLRQVAGEEGFTTIAIVKANGTSTEIISYNFVDDDPGIGLNYYRLNMVDMDRSATYSKIISVRYEGGPDIAVFPNPSNGQEINITIPESTSGTVSIYDLNERKIVSIPTNGSERRILLKDVNLPAGIYVVVFESRAIRTAKRLVIVP